MSRPTFEIVRVVATDAYIADPTAIHEVAGMLTKTPGCLAYVLKNAISTSAVLTSIADLGTASMFRSRSTSGSSSVSYSRRIPN